MKHKIFVKQRLFFALLAALFLLSDAFASIKTEELKKIDDELRIEKAKLKEVRDKESKALNKLYTVTRQLKKTKGDLIRTQEDIYTGSRRISALESEIRETEVDIRDRGKLLTKRLSEAYKNGWGVSTLDLLLASKSIDEFISRQYYLEKLISSDIKLLAEIRDKVAAVAKTRIALETSVAEMRGFKEDLAVKKSDMERQAKIKSQTYEELKARRQEYERRVAELEKGSKELEVLISKASSGDSGRAKPSSTGAFMMPVAGRLVSGFGYRRHPLWGGYHMHTGLDFGAPYGDPIKAADGGEVIFSGWWDGYGKAVVVDHGGGLSTVYGHMSRIYVQSGQKIDKGQIIGLVGSTGFSTGPHLHFEVRRNGKPVDPTGFLR
jgi:murein DD-endopeptidase MepM/ murein hydrolase activator NlpD